MYDAGLRQLRKAERSAANAPEIDVSGRLPGASRAVNVSECSSRAFGGSVMLSIGDLIAAQSYDEGVLVFDSVPEVDVRHELDAGKVLWNRVAAMGSDDLLATSSERNGIMTWRGRSGELVSSYNLGDEKCRVLISVGELVAVSTTSGHFVLLKHRGDGAELRQYASFRVARELRPHFMASYGDVLVASALRTISIWDVAKRRCLALLPVPLRNGNGFYLVDLNSQHLVAARRRSLHVYAHQDQFPLLRVITLPVSDLSALKILTNETALMIGGNGDTLILVSIATGKVLQHLQIPFKEVYCVDVTADARLMVSYDDPGGVATFDAEMGSHLQREVDSYARTRYGKKYIPRNRTRRRRFFARTVIFSVVTTLVVSIVKIRK